MIHRIELAGDEVDGLRQPKGTHVTASDGNGRTGPARLGAGQAAHSGREIQRVDLNAARREFQRRRSRATTDVAGGTYAGQDVTEQTAPDASRPSGIGIKQRVVVLRQKPVRPVAQG